MMLGDGRQQCGEVDKVAAVPSHVYGGTADCKSHPEKTIFRFSREKGFPKSEK